MRGGKVRRALEGQAVVDASLILARTGEGELRRAAAARRRRCRSSWAGRSGRSGGVLAGDAVPDPKELGLDALFPAFFLVLVWTELGTRAARVTAATATLIAVVLIPIAPPGIPVVAASLAVLRRPDGVAMNEVWIAIAALTVICFTIKAVGPVALGGRDLPRVGRSADRAAPGGAAERARGRADVRERQGARASTRARRRSPSRRSRCGSRPACSSCCSSRRSPRPGCARSAGASGGAGPRRAAVRWSPPPSRRSATGRCAACRCRARLMVQIEWRTPLPHGSRSRPARCGDRPVRTRRRAARSPTRVAGCGRLSPSARTMRQVGAVAETAGSGRPGDQSSAPAADRTRGGGSSLPVRAATNRRSCRR